MRARAISAVRGATQALVLAALVMTALTTAASNSEAGTPQVSTKTYQQLNAFWHDRRSSGGSTYRRITWYAGAFRNGDFFYSDLYRYVELCTRAQGKDPCDQTSIEVGATTSPADAHFSVRTDGMTGGTLSGTYGLREAGESGPASVISVRVKLRGTGDTMHERRHHERWQGDCLRARSISVEDKRFGVATGWLHGDVERSLHTTGDANIESERTTTTIWPC